MASTKDYVLSELIRSGEYLSGEALSRSLSISRAAVNIAVRSLREEGYEISSVTNKGYRFLSGPDNLTAGEIMACLSPKRMENVTVLSEVDSTNRKLRDMAFNGAPEGSVVIADCQTSGRGRLGRSFLSPSGTGIYLSYLMRPDIAPADISTVTCWSAVAVANAISECTGVTPAVKWVNDLQLNGMKICGILTEMNTEPDIGKISSVIVGIGINVNEIHSDFPPELRGIASSVRAESDPGKIIRRSPVAAALIREMDRIKDFFPEKHDEYLGNYRRLCTTPGMEVSVVSAHNHTSEVPRTGKAIAINDDFSLKVLFDDGHEDDLSSGEVSVRRR